MASFKTIKRTPEPATPAPTPPPAQDKTAEALNDLTQVVKSTLQNLPSSPNSNPVPWEFTFKRAKNGLIEKVTAIPQEEST